MQIINERKNLVLLTVAMFAIVGMTGVITNQAFANPPGIPDGEKKVYQWMLIGRPNEFNGECGNGARIFVEADDRHAHLQITDGDSWGITDCNGTGNNYAKMTTSDAGSYKVYAVAKGKPGTGIDVCADYISDHEDHLCLIGEFDIKKEGGKTNFKYVPYKYFDAEYEDIIWSIDVTGQAKIQFRVYEVTS